MSTEELQDFAKKVSSVLEFAKLAFGILITMIGAVFTLALWVNNKANAIDVNAAAIAAFQQEGREVSRWRATKDEIDIRFAVILENQQKIIDRVQSTEDKLVDRIDRLEHK